MENRVEELKQWLISQGIDKKYNFAGCYSIKIGDKLVYIGKSANMLKRLAQHLYGVETARNQTKHLYHIMQEAHDKGIEITFDVLYTTSATGNEMFDEIGNEEGVLIRKYLPPLCYQIPKEENYKCYTVNKRAKYITLNEILGGK